MNDSARKAEAAIAFRKPEPRDGKRMWQLVHDAGTLEANTAYCYVLLCDHFADTCLLAETDGRLDGFIAAYRPPGREDTVFVWQIGVAQHARGQGLARRMLRKLIAREDLHGLHFVEATVAPDNAASEALFRSLARSLDVECIESDKYASALFPAAHEPENLFRIGPFTRPHEQ